ncbi:hypothetical protein MCAV_06220 [[Mycoplasma] cavipharyngis]|uniref:hypothetical protein n=1 Tax=[Mycoplasma] cavipharyngis TaxID=92757 RepID=UPI003703FF79
MKLNSLLKKWIIASCVFNLSSFFFIITLLIIIFFYQFGVLLPNNYQVLSANGQNISTDDNNNTIAAGFGYGYISANGFAAFFGAPLGNGTYWQLVLGFYPLTIVFVVLNFIVSVVLIYLGYKSKNTFVLNIGISAMFFPLIGFLVSHFYLKKFGEKIQIRKLKTDKKSAKKSLLKEIEQSINQKANA